MLGARTTLGDWKARWHLHDEAVGRHPEGSSHPDGMGVLVISLQA